MECFLSICVRADTVSMYDECYELSPHLVDVSGAMTRTYAYLQQFSDYFKAKLSVLDPVEDFYPLTLRNMAELYLKLRQLKATVLLVVGEKEQYGASHEVEVAIFLDEQGLRLQSAYTGHREIPLEMGAGIWDRREYSQSCLPPFFIQRNPYLP